MSAGGNRGSCPQHPAEGRGAQSHEKGVKALQEAEERVLLQVIFVSASIILVDAPLVWVWSGEIRTFISGKVKRR